MILTSQCRRIPVHWWQRLPDELGHYSVLISILLQSKELRLRLHELRPKWPFFALTTWKEMAQINAMEKTLFWWHIWLLFFTTSMTFQTTKFNLNCHFLWIMKWMIPWMVLNFKYFKEIDKYISENQVVGNQVAGIKFSFHQKNFSIKFIKPFFNYLEVWDSKMWSRTCCLIRMLWFTFHDECRSNFYDQRYRIVLNRIELNRFLVTFFEPKIKTCWKQPNLLRFVS